MSKHKHLSYILIIFSVILISCQSCNNNPDNTKPGLNKEDTQVEAKNEAHQLIIDMVEAVGGVSKLLELKDVEYGYTYHDLKSDKKDITTERYIFNNELSWSSYNTRELFFPDKEGPLFQSFNGKNTTVKLNNEIVQDSNIINRADFIRKTNYYWLVMMYKLLDDGIHYEKLEDQIVNEKKYRRVKISYKEGVGDAQDIYLLYINPETGLVDQFLFTVMDYNLATPLLMDITYEEVDGLKLMVHRRYKKSNWEGEHMTEEWAADVYSKNIKFNNGFNPEDFDL